MSIALFKLTLSIVLEPEYTVVHPSIAISVIEKHAELEIPNLIGVLLLVLTTIGVVLIPASGFWLVYPAAIAIIFKNKSWLSAANT